MDSGPAQYLDITSLSASLAAASLLTIPETAAVLKISEKGVRRLQLARALPFIKVGGSVRFAASDIVAYLKRQRVEALNDHTKHV